MEKLSYNNRRKNISQIKEKKMGTQKNANQSKVTFKVIREESKIPLNSNSKTEIKGIESEEIIKAEEKIKAEELIKEEKIKAEEKKKEERLDAEEIMYEEQFDKLKIIGSGGYGVVKKAYMKERKQYIAIKKMKNSPIPEETNNFLKGISQSALREIAIVKCLKHKNIVEIINVKAFRNSIYIYYEFMYTDLRKYLDTLNKEEIIHPEIVKSLLFQIVYAVSYCHSKKIVHRDLKPQNLLMDDKGTIKIADFGLSRRTMDIKRPYSREVLTLWYRAPEILVGSETYSKPVDMWSIGCIFAEMILKKPLFVGQSEILQLFNIFQIMGTPNKKIWKELDEALYYSKDFPKHPRTPLEEIFPKLDPDGIDLMKRMLIYDPSKRITATEAMKHSYFDSLIIDSEGMVEAKKAMKHS